MDPNLQCYFTMLTKNGKVIERGKMFWRGPMEAIDNARIMGYGIDLEICTGCSLCVQ